MATVYFTAIIEGDRETGYGVFFPDLPGCVSSGDTVDEAVRGAEEALSLHLAGMTEDKEIIPAPTPIDLIKAGDGIEEIGRALVRAELPGRSVRLNISMDESLVAAIDRTAKARDTTRSGLIAEGMRLLLAK